MLETGNRLRWTTGAFFLLAVMVLIYSGVKLSLLFDTPLVGVSSQSKLAKEKLNQLETLIAEKAKKDWSRSIGRLIKNLTSVNQIKEKTVSSQEIQQVVRYNKVTLPEISGIIFTSGPLNKAHASVIINGNIYSENDEVSGFMIKKITEKGVSLIKKGRHYFIDAPEAAYSIDQGN